MEQRCITPAIASVHSFSVLHVGEWLMKQSLNYLVDGKWRFFINCDVHLYVVILHSSWRKKNTFKNV